MSMGIVVALAAAAALALSHRAPKAQAQAQGPDDSALARAARAASLAKRKEAKAAASASDDSSAPSMPAASPANATATVAPSEPAGPARQAGMPPGKAVAARSGASRKAPRNPVETIRVLNAQKLLRKLGYPLKIDGLFGPKTAAAWANACQRANVPVLFQRVNGAQVKVARQSAETLAAHAKAGSRVPAQAAAKTAAAPAPVRPPASASPRPAPAPAASPQPPAGYDKRKAANAAPDIAAMLRNRKDAYNRKALAAWQVRAGITPDGIYGRGTHAALKHFVGAKAPPPFFDQGTDSYPWASL